MGADYNQMLAASGGTEPYSFSGKSGSLPPGLWLSSNGAITGTPTTPGTYSFTVASTDANGCTGSEALQITVARGSGVYRVPYSAVPTRIITADHGSNGTVTWDASNCASAGYHIVYGYGSGLSSWNVAGGVCGLGFSGSAPWSNMPDPSSDGSGFLWFVVVGDDGGSTEGSWGFTSSGAERGGINPSGVCGMSAKNTSSTCGLQLAQ